MAVLTCRRLPKHAVSLAPGAWRAAAMPRYPAMAEQMRITAAVRRAFSDISISLPSDQNYFARSFAPPIIPAGRIGRITLKHQRSLDTGSGSAKVASPLIYEPGLKVAPAEQHPPIAYFEPSNITPFQSVGVPSARKRRQRARWISAALSVGLWERTAAKASRAAAKSPQR